MAKITGGKFVTHLDRELLHNIEGILCQEGNNWVRDREMEKEIRVHA